MIQKILKFCEIYTAFSQVDNLKERAINRKCEEDAVAGTGNTKREDKDVK